MGQGACVFAFWEILPSPEWDSSSTAVYRDRGGVFAAAPKMAHPCMDFGGSLYSALPHCREKLVLLFICSDSLCSDWVEPKDASLEDKGSHADSCFYPSPVCTASSFDESGLVEPGDVRSGIRARL